MTSGLPCAGQNVTLALQMADPITRAIVGLSMLLNTIVTPRPIASLIQINRDIRNLRQRQRKWAGLSDTVVAQARCLAVDN